MSHAMLKDRNGPSKVAEHRAQIDKTFTTVSGQLFRFHRSILETQGSSSIQVTPAHKIKLYNEFYRVANTHPSVAAEFVEKLRVWSKEQLVPEYKTTLDAALATGDEDQIFNAVSRNFQCFSMVTKVTGTIFHNVNNQLAESPSSPRVHAPKQVLFSAYRHNFYEKIRDRIQGIFFKRVTSVRNDGDLSRLSDLRPIAEIFSNVARSTSATLDDEAAAIYQHDYVDRYLKTMVHDNKNAVREKQASGERANEIAKWINTRADFEGSLLIALVAPENDLHRAIMKKYDDDVVATCTVQLVNDKTYGFMQSFEGGENTVESFRAAVDLFEISARVEQKHPQCVRECVKEFKSGITHRLKKLVVESFLVVHDNTAGHANAFMKLVMQEYRIMEEVIKKMRNHVDLQRANADAFRTVLNSTEEDAVIKRKVKRGSGIVEGKVPFPEIFASFVDSFLRGEEAANSVGESSQIIKAIGTLFSFVVDKDIFGEHFKIRLAKRLLQTRFDEDKELQVLEQMQRQSGKHFIHKFEGMINDVRVAHQIQDQYYNNKPALPCEFEFKILTFAYWPQIKPDENFQTPASLELCQQSFERHYRKLNPTKQLKWQADRGGSVLEIKYPKGTKEVSMNIFQAAVMICIDDLAPKAGGDGIALGTVATTTGLHIDDVKPVVASMLFARGLNLVKRNVEDEKTSLVPEQLFSINSTYAQRMKKLKLPHAATAASARNNEVKEETIDAGRCQMLDAAIVRIMKSRKSLDVSNLLELTIQACLKFFNPQPRQIKLRVESLIQKEFLERSSDDMNQLKYLA